MKVSTLALLLIFVLPSCSDIWMTESQKETQAATQILVKERIQAGQMTEAEGRLILAQTREGMEDQARSRMMMGMSVFRVYQQVGPQTTIGY